MTTPLLWRRLQHAELRAERRRKPTKAKPREPNQAVEMDRALRVLDALIECGELLPPSETCPRADSGGPLCAACENWQACMGSPTRQNPSHPTDAEICELVSSLAPVFAAPPGDLGDTVT